MFQNIGILICLISLIPTFGFADVAYQAGNNPSDILTGLSTLFIFLVIPLVLPVWVIYFAQNKKIILKLKEKILSIFTFLLALVWVYWAYFELTNSKSSYFESTTRSDYVHESIKLLGPLFFYYSGIYFCFVNKLWLKIIGVVVALLGLFAYFFNAMFPI